MPLRAVVLIAVLASGCSLVFTRQPPPSHPPPQSRPQCDRGSGPVAADIVLGMFWAAVAGLAYGARNDEVTDYSGTIVFGSLMTVAHGLSAWGGMRWTSRCARMQDDWARARLAP